jgi:hypothetical protein
MDFPTSPIPDGSPPACNLNVFDARQRERHRWLTARLRGAVAQTRELADGYAFRLPPEATVVQEAAEWIVGREGGPVWLRLSGGAAAKTVIASEFGVGS